MGDASDITTAGGQLRPTGRVIQMRGDDDWSDPMPLTASQAVPAFPVDCLPPWAQLWTTELARETQTPPDLTAMLLLGSLATACGGRMRVRIRGNWFEPLNLFLLAVQPPGSRKSEVFKRHERPFVDWERAESERMAPLIAASASEFRAAEQRVSASETKLSKTLETHERMAAKQDLRDAIEARLAAEEAVPAMPRLLCSDVTTEQLARLLFEQGGRMAVWDAEGCGPFALMLGRYAEGGVANFEVFLRGHAGDSLRVDRVKREPIQVANPALSLVAMGQPELLRSLGERREARGLGLLARVLWFVPESTVGSRQIEPEPMAAHAEADFSGCITTLLKLPTGRDSAHTLELDAEAWPVLRELAARLEPQLGAGGTLEVIGDWCAKLAGAVARIAGLLHAAKHPESPWSVNVSAETMAAAAAVGEYLLAHARAAFEQMGTDPVVADAEYVLRWLRKEAVQTIGGRDLYRGVRGRFKRSTDLEPTLALLTEHGYLRMQDVPYCGTGRKPAPMYHVHPSVRSV